MENKSVENQHEPREYNGQVVDPQPPAQLNHRAEQNLQRIKKDKGSEEKEGEAPPSLQRQPRTCYGQVEPPSNQQMENQRPHGHTQEDAGLCGKFLQSQFGVQQQKNCPGQKKVAGQIVAL